MTGTIIGALLVLHVNIARVEGPYTMPLNDVKRVTRAVHRQYRRQANIKVRWHWRTVPSYETGQMKADVRQLANYLGIFRAKYDISEQGKAALLIVPPLTDAITSHQYGGGAADLKCSPLSSGLGYAAMGDTPRQWDLAPTLLGHELGHLLSAHHTTSGLMHANALIFVAGSKLKDRPAMSRVTIGEIRDCLKAR